jgi:hypothetical protein
MDRMFLLSLSLDELVLFDNFFGALMCPIFYIGTRADLEKAGRESRPLESGVYPQLHHQMLADQYLVGAQIRMNCLFAIAGSRLISVGGKRGVFREESKDERAFSGWQERDFPVRNRTGCCEAFESVAE